MPLLHLIIDGFVLTDSRHPKPNSPRIGGTERVSVRPIGVVFVDSQLLRHARDGSR
jgi:hypothetical protein